MRPLFCGRLLPCITVGAVLTPARVLALGGTTASLLTMLGGFLSNSAMVGVAGLVMLSANLLVLSEAGSTPAGPKPQSEKRT